MGEVNNRRASHALDGETRQRNHHACLLHFGANLTWGQMKHIALALLLLRSICVLSAVIPEQSNPKVRAITAFVRIDRTNFLKQIKDTVVVLRIAESEFKSSGYQVESIRITTQPLAELVSGLSEEQALAFLKNLQ